MAAPDSPKSTSLDNSTAQDDFYTRFASSTVGSQMFHQIVTDLTQRSLASHDTIGSYIDMHRLAHFRLSTLGPELALPEAWRTAWLLAGLGPVWAEFRLQMITRISPGMSPSDPDYIDWDSVAGLVRCIGEWRSREGLPSGLRGEGDSEKKAEPEREPVTPRECTRCRQRGHAAAKAKSRHRKKRRTIAKRGTNRSENEPAASAEPRMLAFVPTAF